MTEIRYELSGPSLDEVRLTGLSRLLHQVVEDGASVNFVWPFTPQDAEDFWRKTLLGPLQDGTRCLWLAWAEEEIVGSVQLMLSMPPNQPHRCDVTKLLVAPSHRRLGIGRNLMLQLEDHAKRLDKSLITLDTRTGDKAEPLYRALGFIAVGIIPDFSVRPDHSGFDATTLMYKTLKKR